MRVPFVTFFVIVIVVLTSTCVVFMHVLESLFHLYRAMTLL